ncbi:hypothetical protein Godav_006191 [Gossypium davidsonii]|uniref:FLZ-type domain-containing protein n=1 Tax=Gossypium davidsonii TaxID=34287 RepID=A0A7J8S345_GOSDV|nr:hypothetical protein [Gossypium davidsonii]
MNDTGIVGLGEVDFKQRPRFCIPSPPISFILSLGSSSFLSFPLPISLSLNTSVERKSKIHPLPETYNGMLLGKRTRHPIKRTASMTGITVDVLSNVENIVQQSFISHDPPGPPNHPFHDFPKPNFAYDQHLLAMVSPRNPGGVGSSGFTTNHVLDSSAPFLRSCCLCKRRLAPGRDIYMYRGDTPFCSLECREQQMKQDERRETWDTVASNKEGRHA